MALLKKKKKNLNHGLVISNILKGERLQQKPYKELILDHIIPLRDDSKNWILKIDFVPQ